MYTLSKKSLSFILASAIAMLITAPILLGSADSASAAALTGDQLFGSELAGQGGGELTGAAFAGEVGLGDAELIDVVTSIIRIALSFLGIIAVVIILLGGFKWMTAAGSDDKVKDAKKLIVSGIIGLVIILAAFAIATFVIDSLTNVVIR